MPEIQLGPLGGTVLWLLVAMIIVGLVFAPTLGGAIVWAVAVAVVALLLYLFLRRLYLRLVGRRGGR